MRAKADEMASLI